MRSLRRPGCSLALRRGVWNDGQRCRNAGLCNLHSGHHLSRDRALQPEPLRSFPFLPKYFLQRRRLCHPGHTVDVDGRSVPDSPYRTSALAGLLRSVDRLDHPADEGQPGTDVQAARNRRPGGETGGLNLTAAAET
jgi:hypothetical protein